MPVDEGERTAARRVDPAEARQARTRRSASSAVAKASRERRKKRDTPAKPKRRNRITPEEGQEGRSGGRSGSGARRVRTQAGSRRYGKAIGDLIGGTGAKDTAANKKARKEEHVTLRKNLLAELPMKQGAKGVEVRYLQDLLEEGGFGSFTLDGIFGPNTAASIKKAQREFGQKATGIVDAELVEALTDKAEKTPEGDIPPNKKKRERKDDVMELEYKALPISGFKVLDEEDGVIETIVSVTGIVDRVKDVIRVGAYEKSMAVRTPKGVWGHDWNTPISRTLEAKELPPGDPNLPKQLPNGEPWPSVAGGVLVRTQFNLETQAGREAYSNVKFFGADQEWSIGYHVPPGAATIDKKTGQRNIDYLDWFEYSPVLFGAMPYARTLTEQNVGAGVKTAQLAFKSLKETLGEEAIAEFFSNPEGVEPEEKTGEAKGSWEERRAAIQKALSQRYPDSWVDVQFTYEDSVVYRVVKRDNTPMSEDYESGWQINYSIDADNKVTLEGEPTEVRVVVERRVVPATEEKAGRVMSGANMALVERAHDALEEAVSALASLMQGANHEPTRSSTEEKLFGFDDDDYKVDTKGLTDVVVKSLEDTDVDDETYDELLDAAEEFDAAYDDEDDDAMEAAAEKVLTAIEEVIDDVDEDVVEGMKSLAAELEDLLNEQDDDDGDEPDDYEYDTEDGEKSGKDGIVSIDISDILEMKSMLAELDGDDPDIEIKGGVRYVRTAAGAARFGLPIGSPIGGGGGGIGKSPVRTTGRQSPRQEAERADYDNLSPSDRSRYNRFRTKNRMSHEQAMGRIGGGTGKQSGSRRQVTRATGSDGRGVYLSQNEKPRLERLNPKQRAEYDDLSPKEQGQYHMLADTQRLRHRGAMDEIMQQRAIARSATIAASRKYSDDAYRNRLKREAEKRGVSVAQLKRVEQLDRNRQRRYWVLKGQGMSHGEAIRDARKYVPQRTRRW